MLGFGFDVLCLHVCFVHDLMVCFGLGVWCICCLCCVCASDFYHLYVMLFCGLFAVFVSAVYWLLCLGVACLVIWLWRNALVICCFGVFWMNVVLVVVWDVVLFV